MIAILAFLLPIGAQPDISKRIEIKRNDKTDFCLFIMISPLFCGVFYRPTPNPTPKPTLFQHFFKKNIILPPGNFSKGWRIL
jgi:hypothetical protein